MSAKIEDLIDRTWDAVHERRDERGGKAATRPDIEPLREPRAESRFSDDFPVLEHLNAVLDLAEQQELGHLASAFRALQGQVRWSQNASYNESTVTRDLLDGYAYAVLSGPDGAISCDVPLSGYLMMGPNVTYEDHQHAPREIYLVLTPGAQWRLDSGEWFEAAAGELIIHEPWQMHAMRTGDRPMLAFAAWLEKGIRTQIKI